MQIKKHVVSFIIYLVTSSLLAFERKASFESWIDLLQGGPELLLRGMTAEENAPINLENRDGR